jgi:C_GCAxxG_C_C family probable redox protein
MTRYTPHQAKEEALTSFRDSGPSHINCSQAVVRYALLLLDKDPQLVTIASYFGGGMGGTGETCGAVTGTTMALGIRDMDLAQPDPELTDRTRARLQELIRDFRTEFGTCRCRDLTGFDLSTPEGHDAFLKSEKRDRCADYVGRMCDALVPLLLPE